jgi:hypothetical protein
MRQAVTFAFVILVLAGFATLLSEFRPPAGSQVAQVYDANDNYVDEGYGALDANGNYATPLYEPEINYVYEPEPDYVDYVDTYDSYYPAVYSVPSAPRYVQMLPGVGNIAQPIIQGVAPQTRTYVQPSCAIAASPSSVSYGGSSLLQWQSQNAQYATLTDLGIVNTSGSWQFDNLKTSKSYTLSVSGQGGSNSCSTSVSVGARPQQPTCSISASPSTITQGNGVTISWSSQNATAAALTGQGSVATQGSMTLYPSQSMTYTLAVGNSAGLTGTCTVPVTVQPQQQQTTTPTYQYTYRYQYPYYSGYQYNQQQYQYQIPTCSVTASPSVVYRGGSVDVSWSSANATQGTLTDVGAVAPSGFTRITPVVSHPIVFAVSNPYQTNSCSTYITVNDIPQPQPIIPVAPEEPVTPQTPRPTCSLKAAPGAIAQGATTTLTWSAANASSATLDAIGSVPTSGSVDIAPTATQTFSLKVSGDGGSRTCTASVTVVPCPSSCANPTPAEQGGFWSWFLGLFGAHS